MSDASVEMDLEGLAQCRADVPPDGVVPGHAFIGALEDDDILFPPQGVDHGGFGEKIIEPAQLVIGAEWDANLRKFCDLMGFPSELVKPRWTLTMRG